MDEIDDDMMLRLCSMVNKAFLKDLDYLVEYIDVNSSNDYICDNLLALGLLQGLDNEDVVDTEKAYKELEWGATKHQLNVVGKELLRIKEM